MSYITHPVYYLFLFTFFMRVVFLAVLAGSALLEVSTDDVSWWRKLHRCLASDALCKISKIRWCIISINVNITKCIFTEV